MKISINELEKLTFDFIKNLGFVDKEAKIISDNFIDAELSGKKSHGLGNLIWFKRAVMVEGSSGYVINTKPDDIKVIKETPVSLHINGNHKTGILVIHEALNLAIKKAKKSGVCFTGLCNTAPSTGIVGYWAKKAAKEDLIFICWNNSNGRDAPYGSVEKLYGTDPITIGIPTNNFPIILDMATSKITVGQLMNYRMLGKKLPDESAIDENGELTTDVEVAWTKGALLPIAGHKGSGLTFIGEILAGVMTGSRAGYSVPGGWGTFFILFDPTMFRPLEDFKKDIDTVIAELKNSRKRKDVPEIFYPGERSQKIREQNLKQEYIKIEDELLDKVKAEMN